MTLTPARSLAQTERVYRRVEKHRPNRVVGDGRLQAWAAKLPGQTMVGLMVAVVGLTSVLTWDVLQMTTHWSMAAMTWTCFGTSMVTGGFLVAFLHWAQQHRPVEMEPMTVDHILAHLPQHPRLLQALERWIAASPTQEISGREVRLLNEALEQLAMIDYHEKARQDSLKKIDRATSLISKARACQLQQALDHALDDGKKTSQNRL